MSARQTVFAYGSNLCVGRFRSRVGEDFGLLGVGQLRGFELRFDKIGADGSGKANVAPSTKESYVLGALYELGDDALSTLDQYEPRYRRQRQDIVLMKSEEIIRAWVYRAGKRACSDSVQPFDWYVQLWIRGARSLSLQQVYVESALASTDSIRDPDLQRRRKWLSAAC